MPFVNVEHCDLHFSDWGEPGGRPVVFVHAWGLSSQMWSQQLPDLIDAGLRCVAYDRRGHGRSDCLGTGYDLDTLADDLAGVVEHLELNDAVLVGHSMGASEVVRYLTRHGAGRVSGVVLSAPTLPAVLRTADNPAGVDPLVFERARYAMRADIGAWMALTPNGVYFEPAWPIADDLGAWTRQQIAGTPLPVLLACQRSFLDVDFRPELKALDVPALVIQGDADTSCPLELTGRPTADLIDDAQLVVIEGAGHGLYTSAASRYNDALIEFVASRQAEHLRPSSATEKFTLQSTDGHLRFTTNS